MLLARMAMLQVRQPGERTLSLILYVPSCLFVLLIFSEDECFVNYDTLLDDSQHLLPSESIRICTLYVLNLQSRTGSRDMISKIDPTRPLFPTF